MGAETLVVMSLVSAAVGAASAYQSGMAQSGMQAEQAKQASMRGELSMLNARSQASEMEREAIRLKASQVAAGAGTGVAQDSSSLLALVSDSANRAELDRQQVLRTGRLQQASGEYDASMYRQASSGSKTGALFGAGASLFDGLTKSVGYGQDAGWFD